MNEDDYCQYEYEVIEAYILLNSTTPVVYAITNGSLIKIGKSTIGSIFKRLSSYTTHNIGTELLWIAVDAIESDVHKIYDKYRVNKRMEWFDDVDGLIKDHIYKKHEFKHFYSIFGGYVYNNIDDLKKSIEAANANMKFDLFREWVDQLKVYESTNRC